MDEGELVFAFFNEAKLGDGLVGSNFDTINRDGVASDEFARFIFAAGELSCNEDINERLAGGSSWDILGE